MATTLLTFNAKIVDPEILEQTLIGRKETLDRLEKELLTKVKNKHTYQSLIIAPRGGGKTHMIQVLYNRLKKNKSISNKILISYMVEDETGIVNFLDFMLRILESFSRYKEVNRKNLKEAIFEISNIATQHQEVAIKNLLLDYIGNKTLIVLIENLNIVFEGMKTDGQAKLRDFMHEYNKISFVATSQNLFAQVQKSDYPFYNFFKIHHLEKLDYQQSLELMQAIASAEANKIVSEQLQKSETQGKIRAIYELTGGNHRLLVSFYSFLRAEIKSDLSMVFIKTMNDLKPYYEQFIKKLPVQEQKIVKHLSLKHKPQKGKDIARTCFIPPNIISKQLSELYNKGHIDKHKEGKDAYYELKEPLMRICFEINESPDGIAKLFVDFLSVIYTSQELKSKYLKFRYAARFQPIKIREKYRREALMMSKTIDPKILEELKTHPDLEKLKTEKEIEAYIKTLDKKDIDSKYLLKANDYYVLKKYEEVIAAYQKAIEINPEKEGTYLNMGYAYNELKQYKEAIAACQKATVINPKNDTAYFNMGIAHGELKQYKEAITAYQKAIDINPENDNVYNNMGYTYLKMENFEEALDIFKQGLEINKDNINLHFNLLHTSIITNEYNAGKTQLTRSLNKVKDSGLLQALVTEDILFPLFRYGSLAYMRSFFSHLIEIFKKEKREEVLWKSFPKAIFELLVHIEQYDSERLAGIEKLLVISLSEEEKMKISLMMLNVGIRYLKEKDQRAIYDLSKEERKVFMEFVIEPRGNKESQ